MGPFSSKMVSYYRLAFVYVYLAVCSARKITTNQSISNKHTMVMVVSEAVGRTLVEREEAVVRAEFWISLRFVLSLTSLPL